MDEFNGIEGLNGMYILNVRLNIFDGLNETDSLNEMH